MGQFKDSSRRLQEYREESAPVSGKVLGISKDVVAGTSQLRRWQPE
jgi:hypothetical protein